MKIIINLMLYLIVATLSLYGDNCRELCDKFIRHVIDDEYLIAYSCLDLTVQEIWSYDKFAADMNDIFGKYSKDISYREVQYGYVSDPYGVKIIYPFMGYVPVETNNNHINDIKLRCRSVGGQWKINSVQVIMNFVCNKSHAAKIKEIFSKDNLYEINIEEFKAILYNGYRYEMYVAFEADDLKEQISKSFIIINNQENIVHKRDIIAPYRIGMPTNIIPANITFQQGKDMVSLDMRKGYSGSGNSVPGKSTESGVKTPADDGAGRAVSGRYSGPRDSVPEKPAVSGVKTPENDAGK